MVLYCAPPDGTEDAEDMLSLVIPRNQAKEPVPPRFSTPNYTYLKEILSNAMVRGNFSIESATRHIERTLSLFDLKVIYNILDVRPYFQGQEVSIVKYHLRAGKPAYLGIIPEQNIPWVETVGSDPEYHSFHILHIPKNMSISAVEEFINQRADLAVGIYIETTEASNFNLLLIKPTIKQFLLHSNKHICVP
jgi:hypothetical protein